jgi:hypothetical protein
MYKHLSLLIVDFLALYLRMYFYVVVQRNSTFPFFARERTEHSEKQKKGRENF